MSAIDDGHFVRVQRVIDEFEANEAEDRGEPVVQEDEAVEEAVEGRENKTVEAEQVTASGIVLPGTAQEKPQEGKVMAVGPGRVDDNGNRIPVDVAEGDVVIYSKYGGTEVKYDGEEYLILSARDVLALVTK